MKNRVKVVKTGDGNTKSSPAPQKKFWFLTFNNYLDFGKDGNEIYEIFSKLCIKFKMQEEIGNESKIIHLQGNFHMKKSYRLEEMKNILYNAHWEWTRNMDAAMDYCAKSDTCTGKKWSFGFPEPIEIIEENDMRPFQKDLLKICLEKPDKRKIYWIYDEFGNAGKTQFLKYMNVKHGAVFSYGGKKTDIINLVYNNKKYLTEKKMQ